MNKVFQNVSHNAVANLRGASCIWQRNALTGRLESVWRIVTPLTVAGANVATITKMASNDDGNDDGTDGRSALRNRRHIHTPSPCVARHRAA